MSNKILLLYSFRFSYCALSCLALLKKTESSGFDVDKAVDFVCQCQNFDGGYGCTPGAESHGGQGLFRVFFWGGGHSYRLKIINYEYIFA